MGRFTFVPFIILTALVAVPAVAQSPATSLGDRGSLRGRLLDADTGQLITRELALEVQDRASGNAVREVMVAGEFVVPDLPPGPYVLRVREKGAGLLATRNVQVATGMAIAGSDIYLRLPGVINAVVVDGSGEPVQGSAVMLVSADYVYGRAQYAYAQQKMTDYRGQVNFSQRVKAGHPYFLLALPPEPAQRTSPKPGTPSFEAVWHPGRPGLQQAFVLRSAERKNVDLVMRKTPTYCVDGRLTADSQPAQVDFEVAIPEVGGYVSQTGGTRGVIARGKSEASGHFQVCGLWPGEFLFVSLTEKLYGRTKVSIVDRDVRNITLNAHSPVSLNVEVHWDNGQVSEKSFNLQFMPVSRAMFSPPRDPTVWERTSIVVVVPSKFTFSLPASTDYVIRGGVVPIGAVSETYFKEVNCGGTISRDILRLGDSPCNLSITLGTDLGKLAATIVDKDNKPDSNSSICIAPSSAATREQIAETGTCSSVDEPGTGSVSILVRPDRYLAVVVPPETSDWVEYILTNRGQGEFVEIKARSTSQLILKSKSR